MKIIKFAMRMIDVRKQIQYWSKGAEEELENARIMIDNKRILPGLFFCHLSIEKLLKAITVLVTEEHPPRTHNLFWLAEKGKIVFNEEQEQFISALQIYQIEGRYPDTYPSPPDDVKAMSYYNQTEKLFQWLSQKL